MTAKGHKAERAELVQSLRSQGCTWVQIAARIKAAEKTGALVAFRLAHGLSQQAVANRWNELFLEISADHPITDRQISYWETFPQSGRQPSLASLKRLAQIYQCATADLVDDGDFRHLDQLTTAPSDTAEVSRPSTTRPEQRLAAVPQPAQASPVRTQTPGPVGESGDEMKRRQLLQSLAALGIGSTAVAQALEVIRQSVSKTYGHDDRHHLDDWEETVADYGYAYQVTPPARLMTDLAADLVAVRSIRVNISENAADYRAWCRIGAALSLLMAKTLSNLGQPQDARRWWDMARHVADDSGDKGLSLRVRGERCTHELYEIQSPQPLLRKLAEATAFARGHACAGLASLHSVSAQTLASSGQAAQAQEELRQVESVFAHLPKSVTADPATVVSWHEDRLRYTQTWVHAYLADVAKTDLAAGRAIGLYPSTDPRTPSQVRLLQAFARVRSGDLREGVSLAQEVYEAVPAPQRTTMLTDLATRIAEAVPRNALTRPDVAAYREPIATPAPASPPS